MFHVVTSSEKSILSFEMLKGFRGRRHVLDQCYGKRNIILPMAVNNYSTTLYRVKWIRIQNHSQS